MFAELKEMVAYENKSRKYLNYRYIVSVAFSTFDRSYYRCEISRPLSVRLREWARRKVVLQESLNWLNGGRRIG
jgi:hypothetical protein